MTSFFKRNLACAVVLSREEGADLGEGLRVQVGVIVAKRNNHLFRLLCARRFNGFFFSVDSAREASLPKKKKKILKKRIKHHFWSWCLSAWAEEPRALQTVLEFPAGPSAVGAGLPPRRREPPGSLYPG